MNRHPLFLEAAVTAGIDLGASLLKVAARDGAGALGYGCFSIDDEDAVLARLSAAAELRGAGFTGAGADRAAARLRAARAVQIPEFEALAEGARALLRDEGPALQAPFLLTSVGTGTPILRVEEDQTTRVGGSPLGGGCALVLGAALTGCRGFQELTQLAARGQRKRVDLLLGDLYKPEVSPISVEATAAHLAKIPRRMALEEADPADLADAVFGLIGDNLGLLCGAIAGREALERVVVAGTTLQGNPSLHRALRRMIVAHGLEVHFLAEGAHAGARGALEGLHKTHADALRV